MNPLEQRILAALLLGQMTVKELAFMLAQPVKIVDNKVHLLSKHRVVRTCGWGDKPRIGRQPRLIELTPAGREWASDLLMT